MPPARATPVPGSSGKIIGVGTGGCEPGSTFGAGGPARGVTPEKLTILAWAEIAPMQATKNTSAHAKNIDPGRLSRHVVRIIRACLKEVVRCFVAINRSY